jgi:hypothetical protein
VEILGPAILTILLFNVLQRMEDWLHQHVFKVGWLVTKNFQTTTILYYTFFLPGVVLYELVRYLVAGALDVRAERAIAFPESQDIAELKLNFIKLNRKAPPWKVFIIQAAPPIVGLLLIYFIAVNVFDVTAIFATLAPGTLDAVVATFTRLITIPDFWIWAYLVFTISGVTIPNWIVITGWRSIFLTTAGVAGLLFLIGVGENVSAAITPSIYNGLISLSLVFGLMMALNGIGTALLSAVENTIERVTGDSATFRNGKLVALRRSEIRAMRQQEREKTVKAQQLKRANPKPALPAGPPSIYRMPLAIPGPPGDEIITRAAARIIEPEERPALPIQGRRQEPTQISADATVTSSTPAAPTPPPPVNRPPPLFNPSRASSRVDDDDDEDEDEDDIEIEEVADDTDDSDNIVIRPPTRLGSVSASSSPFLRSVDDDDEEEDADESDDIDEDESSDEPVYEDVEDESYSDDDEEEDSTSDAEDEDDDYVDDYDAADDTDEDESDADDASDDDEGDDYDYDDDEEDLASSRL